MKGFTLVELLGVFIIIAILFLIAAPIIRNYVLKAEEAIYERQIKNIESAAAGWAAQNLCILPTVEEDFITIYLGELKAYELIDENISNPVTDEEFYNDMEILIVRRNNNYVYMVKPDTGNGSLVFDSLAPTILLNGSSSVDTEINEPYIDKGVIVRDRFSKRIFDFETVIKSNGIEVDEVDTTRFGIYTITYSVDYVVDNQASKKTVSVTRTVNVVDTKAPVIVTPGDTLVELKNALTFNAMTGVSVTDNSKEELSINISGNISAIPGVYNITYSATDSKGNTASVIRKVEVVAPQWTFQVTIPAGSLNFGFAAVSSSMNIEWGDGEVSPFSGTGYPTHNYASPGVYNVTLKGTATKISFCQTGTSTCNALATPTKLSDILTVIPIEFGLTNASYMFAYTNVSSFSKVDFLDEASANLVDMSSMFTEARNFNHPIGNWNTSKVTSMSFMFYNARAFNQPIGTWNTSKVVSFLSIFRYAQTFNQPIGAWNTSSVQSMNYAFNGASAFNQDISNWNTSNVTGMEYMFQSASVFNQPIGNWNTAKVTNMSSMFSGASKFNQPLTNWNTSNVTSMYGMFQGAIDFNQSLSNFVTTKVTNMSYMFLQASSFNYPLANFNTSNVTNMSNMFMSASSFNQDISNFNTSKVTNMNHMFWSAKVFNQPIGGWDTSNVTDMSYMFAATSIGWSVFNQNISTWNTSKVTNMSNMFSNNSAFNQPIGSWNTSSVTNMASMFSSATSFNQNLSNWCVSLISSTPTSFSSNTPAWVLPKPIWGTCP